MPDSVFGGPQPEDLRQQQLPLAVRALPSPCGQVDRLASEEIELVKQLQNPGAASGKTPSATNSQPPGFSRRRSSPATKATDSMWSDCEQEMITSTVAASRGNLPVQSCAPQSCWKGSWAASVLRRMAVTKDPATSVWMTCAQDALSFRRGVKCFSATTLQHKRVLYRSS